MRDSMSNLDIEMGTPQFGEWCPRCHLPSVVRIALNVLSSTGVWHQGDVIQCSNDCEAAA